MRFLCAALLLLGCGEAPAPPTLPPAKAPPPKSALPERVAFDQILIAFKGSFDKAPLVQRSQEEARKLAESIYERARTGGSFQLLKAEYSDERSRGVALGPYVAVRADLKPKPPDEILPFAGLAAVLFTLKPGEVGIVPWDPLRCPVGWFVVRRLS